MAIYHRLTLLEREAISRYLILNYNSRKIAKILHRFTSTITREIKHYQITRDKYRGVLSHQKSRSLALKVRKKRKLDKNKELYNIVLGYLKLRWSPEQIAKRLKYLYPTNMNMQISHESIYAYLYVHPRGILKRRLIKQLRRQHINRRVRDKEKQTSCAIQNFISIDDRPQEVEDRKIPGHWEGDLITGPQNKSAVGTLVERITRWAMIIKPPKKDSASVCEAFPEAPGFAKQDNVDNQRSFL